MGWLMWFRRKKETLPVQELKRLRTDNEQLQAEKRRLEIAIGVCHNEISRLNAAMQKASEDLETLNLARQFDATAISLATYREKRGG